MNAKDFIEFMDRECAKNIAGITETNGVWSKEGGLKQAYEDVRGWIRVFKQEHANG